MSAEASECTARKILIAVDGSEHGDHAFDCKYIVEIRRSLVYLFHFSAERRSCPKRSTLSYEVFA